MLGESHDLFHEFPEYKNRIAELKAEDARFSQLYDEYHVVNEEVERIELEIECSSGDAWRMILTALEDSGRFSAIEERQPDNS